MESSAPQSSKVETGAVQAAEVQTAEVRTAEVRRHPSGVDDASPSTRPSGPPAASAAALPTTAIGRSRSGFRFIIRALGIEQAVRLGVLLLVESTRTALGAAGDRFVPRARRGARREERVARSTRHVVAVLGALKGAFAKAGQFAAVRHDLLPPAGHEALATLRDRVPPLPFESVRRVVEAELGAPLGDLFSHFDPAPVGAASVAQVHLARLPDGRSVAVKVQYPWLEASLRADLAFVHALVWLFARVSGSRFDRRAVLREFAEGLREEVDFLREAAVAGEIARNLADDPQIAVPEVVDSHTTRRVLTMSTCETLPIDSGLLRQRGVDPAAVLEIVVRAYARQVFVDGLFHADPHPGNLFVVDEPGATTRPRVFFVDFGLSRRLDAELRRELKRGIYALIGRDLDAFVEGMQRMGMMAPGAEPGVRASVGAMFDRIAQQSGSGSPLGIAGGQVLGLKDEAKSLLQETPGLQLPNDLLLYAKTLSYLVGLGEELAPEVDVLKLSLPHLLRFLAERD